MNEEKSFNELVKKAMLGKVKDSDVTLLELAAQRLVQDAVLGGKTSALMRIATILGENNAKGTGGSRLTTRIVGVASTSVPKSRSRK